MRSCATQALHQVNGIGTQELARAVSAVKISMGRTTTAASRRTNKWALRQVEIKSACNKWTDEEVSMYECAALGSWESR